MTGPRKPPTVDAVIVTRNRIDSLRQTIHSIQQSTYPIRHIIVSDDSTDGATASFLSGEFPDATWTRGPRRGISANRNHGMARSDADYILLSDDDMLMDPQFVELAVAKMSSLHADLVFGGTSDHGKAIYPNTLGFLGFSNRPYRKGQPYNTANQQCFLLSAQLAKAVPYDEAISAYGYEEMDFAYRVFASGYVIGCLESCVNIHLNPNSDFDFRAVQDASRLYVTFKREMYVNRSPARALLFLIVALPHHLLASIRRDGLKGVHSALSNFALGARMHKTYRLRGESNGSLG